MVSVINKIEQFGRISPGSSFGEEGGRERERARKNLNQ